jgi:formylglycine-generating enzyme required for sulfatase activity
MKKSFLGISLITLLMVGCPGTANIRESLETRKDELFYAHDIGIVTDKIGGTISISSYTVGDVLPPDMLVERTSSLVLPLIFFNMWEHDFQSKLGHSQIINDYKKFMKESLIVEMKQSSKFTYILGQGDLTIDITVKHVDISAPITKKSMFFVIPIYIFAIPGGGSNTSAGPAEIAVIADVSLKKDRINIFRKDFHGQHKTGIISVSSGEFEQYTTMMIEGLSFAIKDLNENIIKAINQQELIGLPVMSSPQQEPVIDAITTTSAITGDTYRDTVTGMEFVFVKGGCYKMGDVSGGGEKDELPVHDVCVDDFYMGKYEVTQAQWKAIMGDNPSKTGKGWNYPVQQVSWDDAHTFSLMLKNKAGVNYRLPTEAEWEYAARSGGRIEKWPGTNTESDLKEYSLYKAGKSNDVYPVGTKIPNSLGLYDMAGNMKEWVSDKYDKMYYQVSKKNNPRGPQNGYHYVIRGGSYDSDASSCRTTYRDKYSHNFSSRDFGCRLVIQLN